MSRYLILVLLNIPFIVAGLISAVVSYKLKKINRRRFTFRVILWVFIFIGLLVVEPLYKFLFSNNLTQTEPLSLFDVVQITGIILSFFIANQSLSKVDNLESRLNELHRELSIKLSQDSN